MSTPEWNKGKAQEIDKLPTITHETDIVIVLNDISRKLSILIEYEAMLHKINLEE